MGAEARAATGERRSRADRALPLYFGLAACSWGPHWACHYYRLETGSSFVVGDWSLSPAGSLIALALYSGFIAVTIFAIVQEGFRVPALVIACFGHGSLGILHLSRQFARFDFEVLGWTWSLGASFREAVVSLTFALLSLLVLRRLRARGVPATGASPLH